MTPASSAAFFKPEFDRFLHAPIGADGNDMPLSVLSALTRLNVDPWEEAADLTELSENNAAERLASLIGQLPGARWTPTESRAIAHRLVELLPQLDNSKVSLTGKGQQRSRYDRFRRGESSDLCRIGGHCPHHCGRP